MKEFLAEADVLSVHIPLRKETEGFVGEELIRGLKKGAIIVNTARGKVIDEDAMIKALEDGHVRQLLYSYPSFLISFCRELALSSRPRRIPRRTRSKPQMVHTTPSHAPPAHGYRNRGIPEGDGGARDEQPAAVSVDWDGNRSRS